MSIEIGDKKAKYCASVYTVAYASKYAGTVYYNTAAEYEELVDEYYNELLDKGYMSANIGNDFDLGDVEIQDEDNPESKYYLQERG